MAVPAGGSSPQPEPRSALNLALTRVVVCLLVLSSSELWDAARWAEAGRALRAPALGLGWALPLLDASAGWVLAAQLSCAAGCVLGVLGWRCRWSLGVGAASALVLFALPQFTGGARHSMHLVWFLALLAFSPCDLRLRLRWWNEPSAGVEAARGLRLSLYAFWALLAAVYFFPGFWKLRESGSAWIWSDNLQNQMFWKWYQFGSVPGWRPDAHPTLLRLAALGVVSFELGFALLSSGRWGRLCAAGLGTAFHWAATELLFLPYQALLGCYVVLIDWEWIWAWLQDRRLDMPRSSQPSPAPRALAVAASLLVGGAVIAGASGEMRAYPFACYPTFQWLAPPDMPDLWIAVVHEGKERWLADSPAHGGARPQSRWGMAWRASGVYGGGVQLDRLIGYYLTLPAQLRGAVAPGDTLRFYAARVLVRPEDWREPPLSLQQIGEWTP
ncbi:MAG TPA: hypothetical protein VG963_11660 [Polyangiaceae bacterium]|nr:hypothetical protein [Polyangiaceae bacterium]